MGGNRRKSHTLNSSGRSKKRKYCGNRYSKTMSEVTGLDYESNVEKQPTTTKIYGTFNTPNDGNGFRIVDFDILCSVISQYTCCMVCHSQTLQVKELEKKGISLMIIITTLFTILFLSANQRCNFSTPQLL